MYNFDSLFEAHKISQDTIPYFKGFILDGLKNL